MTGKPGPAEQMLPQVVTDPDSLAKDPSRAGRFAASLAQSNTVALIENAAPRPGLMRYADLRLPLLIEHGSIGGSYVSNPHSAYILYAQDEIDIVGIKRWRWAAQAALKPLDWLLRTIRINRAVHLDNWLLSTNLHGHWDGTGLPEMRQCLERTFPDHFLILRSIDAWSCPELLHAAAQDGWILCPARQVWVTDDTQRDWKPRNHVASDRRKLNKSGLQVEEVTDINDADAARIAQLYHDLYIGRYTALNPIYSPDFVQLSARIGMLKFRIARNSDGVIMAVAGMSVIGDIVTVPMLGYDTTRPKSEALYRIASYLSSDWAHERGYRHHGSSGASTFKRNRGAKSVIEYMAIYGKHLSPARRVGLQALASTLDRTMVPMLQKQAW